MKDYSQQFNSLVVDKFSDQYTHCYAACGELSKDKPDFVFESYPDERRLFDLSSLTKAVVTVPLVFSKIKNIEERIDAYLPRSISLKNKAAIQWIDLLAHESGLAAWNNLWIKQFDATGTSLLKSPEAVNEQIDAVLSRQDFIPSKPYIYSDLGYLLIQRLLESNLSTPYPQIVKTFLKSLSLEDKIIFLPSSDQSIPTGFCKLRQRELYGEVHDENAGALGGVCGHAGAFASGEGLRSALKIILDSSNGRDLLAGQVRRMQGLKPHPALAGWWHGSGESAKGFAEGHSVGHLGFTGTAFWVDPRSGYYGIFLTNRVIKGRTSKKITQLRSAVFEFYEKIRTKHA